MAADTVARVSASVVDAEGIKGTALSHLYVDSGQTIANVKTAVAAWAHKVDLLSGAEITALRFEVQLADVVDAQKLLYADDPATGIKTAPADDSEVQEAGVFDMSQSGLPYVYGQAIPALVEDLTTSGPVNIADSRVTGLRDLLIGAVLGGHYTGMNTAALTALTRAFRGDRKRRRALFAKSVARA